MSTNPTSTIPGPETEPCSIDAVTDAATPLERPRVRRVAQTANRVLLLVAAIFFGLHFVHLKADFPNHSPWMDWAKYTDEGWYGDAAIRHYQLGHWYVAGDFNPAVDLPVWPAIEVVLFRFTGVSVVAARALTVVVFGLILVCCYRLCRRWSDGGRAGGSSLAPAISVFLLAISPYFFPFMRLAILEPMLILLALAALLAASEAGEAAAAEWNSGRSLTRGLRLRWVRWSVALGLLLPLMVLTKTTGAFLFPAIFWLLWAATGYRLRPFAGAALSSSVVGAATWGTYYGLFVRPRYLTDYRYLFSANTYTGITRDKAWAVIQDTFKDVSWMGKTLSWLALAAVLSSLAGLCSKRLRRVVPGTGLLAALLFWIFGYGAFLAYHDNLQPRYYIVLAIPLTLLLAMIFDLVLAGSREQGIGNRALLLRIAAAASGLALLFAAVNGARQTAKFLLHPEYTWVSAAGQIHAAVERELAAHPEHSRLVLSISGSDLSLMTGLPSICDDFGTLNLADRVALYKPGWFATWNDVEDDKMEALDPMYRLVRVATIPAFDDPERNVLILYRLDPVGLPGPKGRPGRRRSLSVPRRLRTKIGEQPNPVQLIH